MKISALLKYLQENRLHCGVVTDEYGGVSGPPFPWRTLWKNWWAKFGMSTMKSSEEFRPLPGGACEVSGSMAFDKLFAHYDIHEERFATVSGWVNEALGRSCWRKWAMNSLAKGSASW